MSKEKNELKAYIEASIDEKFEREAVIRKTEASRVYLYRHKESGKRIIQRHSKNRNDDVYRILRNKRLCNLPQIYEVCSDDDWLMVLEEYIDGKNLAAVTDSGTLKTKQACKYAYDICNALTELHALGIIHRDIKPANVIINGNNEAVLIDLNIARSVSESDDKDTASLGTVGYAAPEQYGISQSGKSTDIYALGVLLNIMITGTHPAIDQPGGAIRHIITKATSTQISKRYKSSKELQKELRFFI